MQEQFRNNFLSEFTNKLIELSDENNKSPYHMINYLVLS